jgi:hypothetical protein
MGYVKMAIIQYYDDDKIMRLFDNDFVVDILEVAGKEVLIRSS